MLPGKWWRSCLGLNVLVSFINTEINFDHKFIKCTDYLANVELSFLYKFPLSCNGIYTESYFALNIDFLKESSLEIFGSKTT